MNKEKHKSLQTRMIQVACVAFGVLAFQLTGCLSGHQQSGTELPTHPITQGVSAPFAGFIGDELVVGGGCNFPNIPAADGGKKVYYPTIYSLHTTTESLKWKEANKFPLPIAYGATVEASEGLICIGGMNDSTSLKSVFCISKDKDSEHLTVKELPSLPEPIDNAAATCIGRSIYVTGGNQGNGGNALYTLNLDTDSSWTQLANYPGNKRIQPVLLAGNDELYLFGGFEVRTTEQPTPTEKMKQPSSASEKEGIISSDFMVYSLKKNEWSQPHAIPGMQDGSQRALVGAAGTRVNNQLILAGGVNYTIFKAAIEGKVPADYMKRPADWYLFSKDVLVYDLTTKQWDVIPNIDGFNKAGGSLLYHNEILYMVCGEIKPGIRTNEIKAIPLKDLLNHSL